MSVAFALVPFVWHALAQQTSLCCASKTIDQGYWCGFVGADCGVHSARERSETRSLFLSQARSQTRSQTRSEARFARNTLKTRYL